MQALFFALSRPFLFTHTGADDDDLIKWHRERH